jgi:hypothetical protein
LLLLWVFFSQQHPFSIVLSELFGPRHRSVGMCFVYWVMFITGLSLSLVYKLVEEIIGHVGWIFVFSVSSVIIAIPVVMHLPETKGIVIGATTRIYIDASSQV